MDDLFHLGKFREFNVMEDAAAQEGIGKFFFRIGSNDDDGAVLRLYSLFCLLHIELHLVHLPEQVIGKLQIRLVDLVDQQDDLFLGEKGFPDLSIFDILADIGHLTAELAVVQALDHIIGVEAVLGLCGGFDVPGQELFSQSVCDRLRQHGLAGTRLPLDQEGLFECHGDIDGLHQIFRGNVCLAGFQMSILQHFLLLK